MIYKLIILNSYWISIIVIPGYPFCIMDCTRRRPLLFKKEVFRVLPHRGDYTVTPQDRRATRPVFLLPVPRQQERREVQAGQEGT
jgi:hypothetical protein